MNIVKITIGAASYNEAVSIAEKRAQKANSVKFSNHSEFNIHLMGLVSELAFAQKTGLEVQKDVRLGGDGGADFILNSKIIQLKTRDCKRFPHPGLLVRPKYAKADYYILSTWSDVAPCTTAFIGYTDHDNLIKDSIDLGYGNRYYCPRSNLGDVALMFDAIEKVLKLW
jgi:hypothetical protein